MGHGRSDGDRVHVDSVDEYVDDVFAPCGPGTTAAPAATLLRCRPFHGERIHWMYHFYADTLGNEILLDPFTLS